MTAKVKLFFAVLALLLFISSGCRRTTSGPSGPSISGKVTLNGKPVTGGTMFLVPKSGPPEIRVEIKPDGTFKKSGVRTGEMQVAIETESIKGAAGGGIGEKEQEKGKIEKLPEGVQQPGNSPVYVPINRKYADAKTSGLTWTITDGEQVKDFDLKD